MRDTDKIKSLYYAMQKAHADQYKLHGGPEHQQRKNRWFGACELVF